MPNATRRRDTYTGYSVSCAFVWAGILAVAQRRLDPSRRRLLALACAQWWGGWLSATIARAVYPPPRQLEPDARRRIGIASLGLIAIGASSVIRLFASARRPAPSAGAADRR